MLDNLIYNVLLAVITALCGVIATKLIPYLRAKYAEADAAMRRTRWAWVADIAGAAVRAVEQTATDEIHGEGKRDIAVRYVKDALAQAGFEMSNEQIITLIEAAVRQMNAPTRTVQEAMAEAVRVSLGDGEGDAE